MHFSPELRDGVTTASTSASYRLAAADLGKHLSCRVTLTTRSGDMATATSQSVLSEVVLTPRALPRLVGGRSVHARLTCVSAGWNHSGPLDLAYRWLRDGKAIGGVAASRPARTVAAADVGHSLSCRVSARTAGQLVSRTTRAAHVPRTNA